MTTNKNQRGRYASINGLNLYYELHGSGQPLVVPPGAYSTIEAMGELVPLLAARRRVSAAELQGHGHTADIERPLRFELLADDIAALIRHLELEQADIFGFSLGVAAGCKPPSGTRRWFVNLPDLKSILVSVVAISCLSACYNVWCE
jgi:pimeloyl-ACP methyl ester carboxylesterase